MSSSSTDGLFAVAGSFVGLSTIATGLRFTARRLQKSPLMMDDWMTIPALLSYIAAAICIFISIHDKILGSSSSDFTAAQTAASLETAAKLTIALDVVTNLALACTKLSALAFYHRTFCVTSSPCRGLEIITVTTMVIVVMWVITFNFLAAFQCGRHFSALWDGSYLEYCTISFPYAYGSTLSDFLLNIWILVLPIHSVVKTHASLSKTLSIVGVFLFALVGLGASIARLVAVITVETGGPVYLVPVDQERANTQVLYFIVLESGMSLIAVNLFPLGHLCATAIPRRVRQSFCFTRSKAGSKPHAIRTNSGATAGAMMEFKGVTVPKGIYQMYASVTVCSGPGAGPGRDLEANILRGID